MTDLKFRRSCVKYGSFMSDSWRIRVFCFDTQEKKYRYFTSKEDIVDKVKKAMNLSKCEYEITSKSDPNITKWDDLTGKNSLHRLSMKFEQRNKRPIFFYSNDLDELYNLKHYGSFCQKGEQYEGKLEQLLASLSYAYGAFALNSLIKLFDKMIGQSKTMLQLILNVTNSNKLMNCERNVLLTSWATMVTSKTRRYKPIATIRLSLFLCSLTQIKNINERQIIESTKRILNAYQSHRNIAQQVFDEQIVESANRRSNGMIASAVFSLSDQIAPIATGRQAVPREHMGFVKFDFPQRPFKESQCQVRIDAENYKVKIVSDSVDDKTFGELLISDISSMVLNDEPTRENKGKKWLRINGRKIRRLEEFKDIFDDKDANDIIDPASKFLALSIDSYLSKKSLLEIKLYSIRIKDISDVIKELGSSKLKLRIKITTGRDIFWTSTSFIAAKIQDGSMSCELKIICRVRVDPVISEFVEIAVCMIAAEKGKVPDVLKTLKKEIKVGFTKISLLNLPKQKKITWIPFNGGIGHEDPFLNPKQPIASMSLRLIKDVPGNYPEAPLTGKAYNINDLVTYIEEIPLYYPKTEEEFYSLRRNELEFDPSKAGKLGCPLRYPSGVSELQAADLDPSNEYIRENVRNLVQPQPLIPFVFRLPADEDSFIKRGLPGNYNELIKKYEVGELISELDSYKIKRICMLKAIDDNDTCYLIQLDQLNDASPEILKKHINDVKPMADEGVCTFDRLVYYPSQMKSKHTDHEWSLFLGFADDEERNNFLRDMKEIIRDYWYAQRTVHSFDTLKKDDITVPTAGQLQLYITEAKNLGMEALKKELNTNPNMKLKNNKLKVRIGFKSPKLLSDLFASVFMNESLLVSVTSALEKTDICIEHEIGSDFTWRTAGNPAGEMVNLGRLVVLPKTNVLLTLTVSTIVLKNDVEENYSFGTAEIPLNQLLNSKCPSHYYWVLLQNDLEGSLPQIKLWSMFYPEDLLPDFFKPKDPVGTFASYLLMTAEKQTEVVDMYKQVVSLGEYNPNYMRVEQDFMTGFTLVEGLPEEEKIINAMIVSKVNPKKGAYEPWEYKLINSYRYLKSQARENVFRNMSMYLWDAYLTKLMMNATKTKTMQQFGAAEAARVEARLDEEIQKSSKSLHKLDRIRFWREAGSWKYSNIVALCKLGLPKELRPTLWSELFGLSGVNNPDFEELKENRYRHYLSKGIKKDSLIFRQMEQDIQDVIFTQESEAQTHGERAGVLRVAKAYYGWCLERNKKSTDENSYVYFKGILNLIQKVWQLFKEVEAFWCIIGFANALPYLFQSQNVLVGKLSWNHKLLLLAISTITEIKYPEIHAAITRHGLPIEYYVSDKVFTMLSTVYPTDTLLRFYDVIALEAASKQPIRAMWVILTGCLMLLILNENYIKAARSADEIELLINNTGINKLNTQKLVEDIYQLSTELFSTYNPTWEKFLAVVADIKSSAVGMEQTWSAKAQLLEAKYQPVKALNNSVTDIVKDIRELVKDKSKLKEVDDKVWINNFVRRFCKYYGDCSSRETANTIYLYLNRCWNIENNPGELNVKYGEVYNETANIDKNGAIDKVLEFVADPNDMIINMQIGELSCELNFLEYETDMPITLDKALILTGEEIIHNGKKPQPFISMVFIIVTKTEDCVDDAYTHIKQSMMYESRIIKPTNKTFTLYNPETITGITKNNIKKQFERAGLRSIYAPGVKVVAGGASSAENDKKALRHLFNLVNTESLSYYASEMPKPGLAVESLTKKVYAIFSAYYSGKLPLKRVIISIIAASLLTVDEKLSYFYDMYTCISGAAGNSFLLEDIIELVQLLCELHLVYIPPECIPHLTEQVMTNGGVNRITDAYLISQDAIVSDVVKKAYTKTGIDLNVAIRITEKVQSAFAKYWELWGHKQVFASDPNSFCGLLNTVLGGYKGRPKNPGPYKLIICYKHHGEGFYKVLEYDKSERLILPTKDSNELNSLLLLNRDNLCFVGQKITMTKEEFTARIKRIPMLTELMRLQISLNSSIVNKHSTKVLVNIIYKDKCVAIIRFCSEEAKSEEVSDIKLVKPIYKFDSENNVYDITLPCANQEDLLAEIKGQIFTVINDMIKDELESNLDREIPTALDPNIYLNHSLQFFSNDKPLDDYSKIEQLVH